MNAGFSNLDELKRQLLAGTLQDDDTFDLPILALGQGVASGIERFCNRKFLYEAGIQETFTADRSSWFAERPVVTVFTRVELRFFMSDPWTDISGQPLGADEGKGYINFGYTLGRNPMQVRLTYNGGYYWNTQEPEEPGYIDPINQFADWFAQAPADILQNAAGLKPSKFLLPQDLKLAWLLQCRKVWEAIDKVGDKILDVGSNTRQPSEALAGLDFVPVVQAMLQPYKRYQLT